MQRITISLPDELASAVKRESRRRGCSVSALAREAMGEHLHLVVEPGQRRKVGFAAIGKSGRPAVTERIDEVLEREWTHPDFGRGR